MLGRDGQLHHFEIVGTYEDLWQRVPDGWRIAERTWRHGWIWGDYPLASLPGDFDAPAHPDPAFGRITERSTSDGIAR